MATPSTNGDSIFTKYYGNLSNFDHTEEFLLAIKIKEDFEKSNRAHSNISTQASGSQEPPETVETFQLDDCFAEPLEEPFGKLDGPLYTFYEFLKAPESPRDQQVVNKFDSIPINQEQDLKNRIVANWLQSQNLNDRQATYCAQENASFQYDTQEISFHQSVPSLHPHSSLSFRHHENYNESSIMTRVFCCFYAGDHREEQYKVAEPCPEPQKYSWDKERPDPKNFMFSNLENEVKVKKSSEIGGQQFVIENCKNSCLLLLDNSASITVDDCTECLIVIGPCKGSVFIRDCKACLVYAICQQFRTRDSELGVYIFCATDPIIEESTVEFFPLRLSYNKIKEQMNYAGLSPFTNHWFRVHDFTPNGKNPRFTLYKDPTPGSLSDQQRSKVSQIFGIEGLSFNEKESFLFVTEADKNFDLSSERVLILCKMGDEESVEQFYSNADQFLRELLHKHIKLLTTKDFVVQKNELQTVLQNKSVKHSGRIVIMEITGRDARNIALEAAKQPIAKEMVEIIPSDKTAKYKEKLYRLANAQNV